VFKPLDGSEKLLAAVADSFATIDRWRTRLRELAQRRKAERQLCDTP
jgi:GH24 family phage-related lysozyme (muramidase)